jgi:hypothetical protein
MGGRKLRAISLDIATGFANNFKIADDGILHQFVLKESGFIQILGVRSIASRMCAR